MTPPTMTSPAHATAASDQEAVRRKFKYWQARTMLGTFLGYAVFYLIRKNISAAMPQMESHLGIGKVQLGTFLTLHGTLYGISKFASGFPADRWVSRWFMGAGLLACILLNFGFAFSPELVAAMGMGAKTFYGVNCLVLFFGVFWALNGWFQGIGYPPIARLMTHWYPPKVLASRMAVWNTSHSVGTVATVVLCGYLVTINTANNWRLCFIVPAILALGGLITMVVLLRDTPEAMGLPPVEGTEGARAADEPLGRAVVELVFKNPYIWFLSFGNFFVYVVRFGFFDWGFTYLSQARGMKLSTAGWTIAAFEFFGGLGMLAGGWISDKVFAGRSGRTCMFYMIGCTAALFAFWRIPNQSYMLTLGLLCVAGFFVYGPQALVGIAAANLGTKRAAGTAGGLTGIFGYASTIYTGTCIGWIVKHYNWDIGFFTFIIAAVLGAAMFALCWPAPAHGYGKDK